MQRKNRPIHRPACFAVALPRFSVAIPTYWGLALFIQSFKNDRRSAPVTPFLSARFLHTVALSCWLTLTPEAEPESAALPRQLCKKSLRSWSLKGLFCRRDHCRLSLYSAEMRLKTAQRRLQT